MFEAIYGVFVLLIYVAGASVFAHGIWSNTARAARRRVARWRFVAKQRGLVWHASADRMSGWTDDRYVMVWAEPQNDRPRSTCVAVALWPPLDLGLRATVDYSPSRKAKAPVRVDGDDRDRAARLFTPDVNRALNVAAPRSVLLADDCVVLATFSLEKPRALLASIERAIWLARAIDAARAAVPPPPFDSDPGRLIADDWKRLASEQHFASSTTPFGFHGYRRELEVRVFAKRKARGRYGTTVMAAFRRPMGIGFCARPHWDESAAPWSTERFTTGDAEFDQRFHTYAFESEYVRQALSDRARSRFVELSASWGRVYVDDYGVRIEAELVGAKDVLLMLDEAISAAELVDFTRPERSATYR